MYRRLFVKDFSTHYQLIALSPRGRTNYTKSFVSDLLESRRSSLSRTRRVVQELIQCNDFNIFVTLTSNVLDESYIDFRSRIAKVIKKFNRVSSRKLIYVLVFEYTPSSHLIHAHGVFNFIPNSYINSNGFLSSLVFDSVGFQSFSKFSKNKLAVSRYITKYVTKEVVSEFHCSSYLASRGLSRPVTYKYPDLINLDISSFVSFNDYCSTIEISKEKLQLLIDISKLI